MGLLDIIGYFSALIIGVSLGLIGGGGSILAVPSLAYLFLIDEKAATAYSLFIVGVSSLVGGIRQHFKGYVAWKTAFVFGIPAIMGVTFVRHFVIPALPEVLMTFGDFEFTRRMGMFGLFALLMIPAAISMLKSRKEQAILEEFSREDAPKKSFDYTLMIIEGLLVGAITGLVGAGGGFLIIPSLVILAKKEMKVAIGTSLIIIAMNALFGFFLGDALTQNINWNFLLVFTALSLVGIFIGSFVGNFIDGKKLKKGFGYFIFVMAFFIFYMEFIVKA